MPWEIFTKSDTSAKVLKEEIGRQQCSGGREQYKQMVEQHRGKRRELGKELQG